MQGDDKWRKDRAGKITASRIADVMAFSDPKLEWCTLDDGDVILESFGGGKTGEKKARAAAKRADCECRLMELAPGRPLKARFDYLHEIVTERLTGEPVEGINAKALAYGKEVEPHAIAAYEAETGLIVQLVDFVVHPLLPYIGASPDFLAGTEGGGECKCPMNSAIHLATIRNGMPEEHMPQVQCNLWVTGRKWWDFCSYDPRMPEYLRLYRQRVLPDPVFISKMAAACAQFNAEAEAILATMQNLKRAA